MSAPIAAGPLAPAEIDRLTAALGATAARLTDLARTCPEAAWRAVPPDGGWSALDTLVHICACADLQTPRCYQIAVRAEVPLPDLDDRRWAEVAGYAETPAAALAASFAVRRHDLLRLLRRLSPADWHRAGLHEQYGPITIHRLATHIASHEAEHLTQIESALTLTLTQRERGRRQTLPSPSRRGADGRQLPPLPAGEGRGEGVITSRKGA